MTFRATPSLAVDSISAKSNVVEKEVILVTNLDYIALRGIERIHHYSHQYQQEQQALGQPSHRGQDSHSRSSGVHSRLKTLVKVYFEYAGASASGYGMGFPEERAGLLN